MLWGIHQALGDRWQGKGAQSRFRIGIWQEERRAKSFWEARKGKQRSGSGRGSPKRKGSDCLDGNLVFMFNLQTDAAVIPEIGLSSKGMDFLFCTKVCARCTVIIYLFSKIMHSSHSFHSRKPVPVTKMIWDGGFIAGPWVAWDRSLQCLQVPCFFCDSSSKRNKLLITIPNPVPS